MSAVVIAFPNAPRNHAPHEGWVAVAAAVTCAARLAIAAGQGRSAAMRAARRANFGFRVGLCDRWLAEIVDAEIAAERRA